jgi:uncharacterized LabA/DUF88 family protein
MYFRHSERVAVLIDGAELRATAGGIGIDIDFRKLLALFRDSSQLARAIFYFVDRDDGDESTSLKPLTDWLSYQGYKTVACQGRDEPEPGVRRRNKNFLNVRLAVDALEMAAHVDHVVIFSGDNVLCPVVDALKWRGVRVSIVSTLQLRPPMVADELRRHADQFIDLADIVESIAKDVPVEERVAGVDGIIPLAKRRRRMAAAAPQSVEK